MPDTQADATDMRRELQELMRHAEALLNATTGEMNERVKEARDRLDACLAEARQRYEAAGGDLKDTLLATDQFIHAKPYQAIGGTFLVGLLLGWLLRGK